MCTQNESEKSRQIRELALDNPVYAMRESRGKLKKKNEYLIRDRLAQSAFDSHEIDDIVPNSSNFNTVELAEKHGCRRLYDPLPPCGGGLGWGVSGPRRRQLSMFRNWPDALPGRTTTRMTALLTAATDTPEALA
jgi:hypothetical protein